MNRDLYVIIMDGDLRCLMRRDELTNRYSGFTYHGYDTEFGPWKVNLVRQRGGCVVRLERKVKSYRGTSKQGVTLMNPGDEIEIAGTVGQKGANWVFLDNTNILSYNWPEMPEER
jgi:hypothetical protein